MSLASTALHSAPLRSYACAAVQRSLDSSVAVLPEGGGGKQGKGQNTAGSPLSNGAAAAAAAGSSTFAASVPHHPHSTHYMHFRPDCAGVDDYHTRKRDHSALPQGVLDHEGILAHTDFDIDLSRCDADNDEHFAEYVERRIKFEEQLKILYENTPSQRHQQAATAAGGRATRMTGEWPCRSSELALGRSSSGAVGDGAAAGWRTS